MENCKETFLDDVVKVRIYRTMACQSAIPYGAFIYAAEVSLGTPSIELALSPTVQQDVAVGNMPQSPTVKVSSKQQRAGTIYQHEVTATIDLGADDVIKAAHKLRNADFHIIYIKAGGEMLLTQSLPNTCDITIEDNAGSNRTATVKVSAKSVSALIAATERQQTQQ